MFDEIYCVFLDERHFGPPESLERRMELLTGEERAGMEGFLEMKRMKMRQTEERTLDEHLMFVQTINL